MAHLWKLGYAPEDIITNIFRVCKHLEIKESLKLKYVQVKYLLSYYLLKVVYNLKAIKILFIFKGLF